MFYIHTRNRRNLNFLIAAMTLVVGLVLVNVESVGAAAYNLSDNLPPKCTVNFGKPLNDMIYTRHHESGTGLQNFDNNKYTDIIRIENPMVVVRGRANGTSSGTVYTHVYIFNTNDGSTTTEGVEVPHTSTPVLVNNVSGYIRFSIQENGTDSNIFGGVDDWVNGFGRWQYDDKWNEPTTAAWQLIGLTNYGRLYDTDDKSCLVGMREVRKSGDMVDFIPDLPEHIAETPDRRTVWEQLVDGITDMISFVAKIPQMMVSLFVPESSTINTLTDDMIDFFGEKLGFITYPFEFIAGFFGTVVGLGNTGSNEWTAYCDTGIGNHQSTWGSVEFGQYFGKTLGIKPCAFQSTMPTIFSYVRLIIQGLTVFALIRLLLNKHDKVVAR